MNKALFAEIKKSELKEQKISLELELLMFLRYLNWLGFYIYEESISSQEATTEDLKDCVALYLALTNKDFLKSSED